MQRFQNLNELQVSKRFPEEISLFKYLAHFGVISPTMFQTVTKMKDFSII